MIVMKFGGTSLGTVERIRTAAEAVRSAKSARPVIILSAMGGVTDQLLRAAEGAIHGRKETVHDLVESVRDRHHNAISELITDAASEATLRSDLDPLWDEMQNVLTGVLLLRELSARSRDLISSMGERLIVPVFTAYLNEQGVDASAVDARAVILTHEDNDFAVVDFAETRRRCRILVELTEASRVPVVTGFLCSTPEGVTTTLGRGSSDYSATIIGHCIRAGEIQIWTDVDGIMTADPRLVPSARVLPQISYKEAAEMSYFGAKVLHPNTIMPAADLGIPLRIKNTLSPEGEGTLITEDSPKNHQGVKTVTSITGVSLVSIEGRGMIGVPGTAQRAFATIAGQKINVLMFSQGSSEQHISLVVSRSDGPSTVRALRREFQPEIEKRQVDRVTDVSEIAIIALVGEGMKTMPGIAARTFTVIGAANINIMMIAQGSSELNLSFVVESQSAAKAVGLIHDAFELGS